MSVVGQVTSNNPDTLAKTTNNESWYYFTNHAETGLIPLSGGNNTLYAQCYFGNEDRAAAAGVENAIGILLNTGSWAFITGSVCPRTIYVDHNGRSLGYGSIPGFGARTDIGSPVNIQLLLKKNGSNADRQFYPHSCEAWITYSVDNQNGSVISTGSVYTW
jgi:hypothetical protein